MRNYVGGDSLTYSSSVPENTLPFLWAFFFSPNDPTGWLILIKLGRQRQDSRCWSDPSINTNARLMFVVSGSLSLLRISIGVFQGPDSPSAPRPHGPLVSLKCQGLFFSCWVNFDPFVTIVGWLRSLMRQQQWWLRLLLQSNLRVYIKQGFLASWRMLKIDGFASCG